MSPRPLLLLLPLFLVRSKAVGPSRSDEKLIFQDDFNRFDLSVWKHEITASGGGNWEFEWYGNNRNNSYVENGTLLLQATLSEEFFDKEPTTGNLVLQPGASFPDTCSDSNNWGCRRQTAGQNIINPIQSARISTKESFSFKFGRVEVRAKLPKGDWLWPAIWLLPRYSQYGVWPASGEIDLMESRGNAKSAAAAGCETMQSTLHWGPKFSENMFNMTHVEHAIQSGDLSMNFHTFGLYWNSSVLFTYLDDESNVVLKVDLTVDPWTKGDFEHKFSNPRNPWRAGTSAAPFDEEFYLIMNLACGGTGGGNGFFPDDMPGKPWKNTDTSAPFSFYEAKEEWLKTWTSPQLSVDSVKVWAFPESEYSIKGQRFTAE